jgi:hypothetical protein
MLAAPLSRIQDLDAGSVALRPTLTSGLPFSALNVARQRAASTTDINSIPDGLVETQGSVTVRQGAVVISEQIC